MRLYRWFLKACAIEKKGFPGCSFPTCDLTMTHNHCICIHRLPYIHIKRALNLIHDFSNPMQYMLHRQKCFIMGCRLLFKPLH